MATAPSLIAFGSLDPLPALDRLAQLRDSPRQQPLLEPVVEAIHDLADDRSHQQPFDFIPH